MNDERMERLLNQLKARAEYWKNQTTDPHGIGQAVYVALLEVTVSVEHAINDAKE